MTDLLKQSLAKNISILETVFNTKSSKLVSVSEATSVIQLHIKSIMHYLLVLLFI